MEKIAGRTRNRSLKDYTGTRFGLLTAVSLVERDISSANDHVWLFKCDCGSVKGIPIKRVRSGNTSSCGCLARVTLAARNTTHGLSKAHASAYRTWKDMRGRCLTPGNTDYPSYGGRGISVCERWDSFALFLSDMGDRPDGKTLDRIEVNGNYEPGNCRWADAKEQANNKRNNHIVSWDGVDKTLAQWCDQFGIEPSKVRYRLARGWPLHRAFNNGVDGRE